VRDPLGRSLHDRDAEAQSETRQMAESDRRRGTDEKVLPYLLAVVVVFVLAVVVIIATR
jgi:hypothetical protein